MTAANVIERLDRWLAQQRPDYYASLRCGLTDNELMDLEKFVGFDFPEPFRALYRWRNGQDPLGEPLMNNFCLMSQDEVRVTWNLCTEMQEGGEWDEPQWFCRGWIPFLSNRAGSNLCLDLNGSFTGTKGQVIEFWGKDSDRNVVAPDFLSWLNEFVRSLEAGVWWLHPKRGNFEEVDLAKQWCPCGPDYPLKFDADTPLSPTRKRRKK